MSARKVAATVPVSERALRARVTRKLRATEPTATLHSVPERSRWYGNYGPYYVTENNVIVSSGHDLVLLARTLGCIQPYERLEE